MELEPLSITLEWRGYDAYTRCGSFVRQDDWAIHRRHSRRAAVFHPGTGADNLVLEFTSVRHWERATYPRPGLSTGRKSNRLSLKGHQYERTSVAVIPNVHSPFEEWPLRP